MEHREDKKIKPRDSRVRKPSGFLVFITIILALALAFLSYEYYRHVQEAKSIQARLEEEKDELSGELKDLFFQYDSLKTENDTMNMKLAAEQNKIEKLLTIQADNLYKISLYRKELETLRKVLKSYIIQIDSLNTRNKILTAENIQVRSRLQKIEREKEELHHEKEELSTKVEKASVLSAKDIVVSPLNRRSREKDRVSKIEKIRVCFTLRENSIVESGPKTLFLRITRPDQIILTDGVKFFEYQGEQMVYTASREVDYENSDVDVCIYWDNDGTLIPGTYGVELYTEGNMIGSTQFALK